MDNMAEFIKAFVKVQASIEPAIKNSINPHFKSKFADLTSCYEACRKILSENGFAIIQQPYIGDDGATMLRTNLMHVSGQSIAGEMHVCDRTATSQQKGSAMTYVRRYSLVSMVGLATEDDDGNSANEHKPQDGLKSDKKESKIPQVPMPIVLNVPDLYKIDFGPLKGKALKDCGREAIEKALQWAIDHNAKPAFQEAALAYLDNSTSEDIPFPDDSDK